MLINLLCFGLIYVSLSLFDVKQLSLGKSMKKITLSIAMLLCCSSVFGKVAESEQVLNPIVQPASEFSLRKETIAQVRKNYENGFYDDFLREMTELYEKSIEKGGIVSFAKLRNGELLDAKWKIIEQKLKNEKNRALIEAVDGQESLFAKKVRNIGEEFLLPEQERAIERMESFRHMFPNTGKNKDENATIDLDLEYEYKIVHLGKSQVDHQSIDTNDRFDKKYVLQMEFADKLLAAACGFEDESLKHDIELYAQNLDDRLAQNWDQHDLNVFFKGKSKLSDATQNKISSILKSHQEKIIGLTKQIMEEEQSPMIQVNPS